MGTELSQPPSGSPSTPGYNPGYGNYLRASDQAQGEHAGAIGAQGPGITGSGDNDAATGGDYDDSGN